MSKPYSRKSRAANEKLTAEFTSGELVIGICVALFCFVACFLAGVLVGRFERSMGQDQIAAEMSSESQTGETASDTPPSGEADAATANDDSEQQGVQTSPRAPTRSQRQTYTSPEERTGPRSVELAPPPTQETSAGVPQNAPLRENRISPPAQETDAESEGPEETTPEEAPEPEAEPEPAPEPEPESETEAPAEAPDAGAATDSASETSAADSPPLQPAEAVEDESSPEELLTPLEPEQGGWAVQLANLGGNNREQRARDFARDLRNNHNIVAEVIPNNDGASYLVAIRGYRSRDAALNALEEIRKLPDLSGAFLKEMP